MKLNKFHVRRLIASLLVSPLIWGAHLAVWFALTMLGAGGSYELSLNAVPSLILTWVVLFTFWTEFYAMVNRLGGGDN